MVSSPPAFVGEESNAEVSLVRTQDRPTASIGMNNAFIFYGARQEGKGGARGGGESDDGTIPIVW
jgi:hypothetical protein